MESVEPEIIESKLRDALINRLAMKQAKFLDPEDDLVLDSLSQTELRIFIEEEFGIPSDPTTLPIAVTESLGLLVSHVQQALVIKNMPALAGS